MDALNSDSPDIKGSQDQQSKKNTTQTRYNKISNPPSREELAEEIDRLNDRISKLLSSGRLLIKQRDTALEENARLSAALKSVEADLKAMKGSGGGGRSSDQRFQHVKAAFARYYHPDRISASGFERKLREEVFKEFWSEIERIERGEK